MKKFSTILLDMDGVLADFHKAALTVHGVGPIERENWPVPGQCLTERLGLDGERWDNGGKEAFWGPIVETPNFWVSLEPFSWVEDLLQLCESFTGRAGVVICTSPAKSFEGDDKRQKMIWLNKHEIFKEVRFSHKKAEYVTPQTLLIDDWEKQVDPFLEKGGKAILFPQPWNANHTHSEYPIDYVQQQLDLISRSL